MRRVVGSVITLTIRRGWLLALAISAGLVLLQGCASSSKVATKRLERGQRWPASVSEHASKEYCTSTREYVTALEFLRSHNEFSLNDSQSQDIAEKVSKGCTGAADRFARVAGLLLKANVGSKDAVKTGMEFATKSDAQTDGFVTVFRHAYLREHLDMDPYSSMQLARSVAADYTGDIDRARGDFIKIVRFCTGGEGLDLPRPQCGALAAQLAQLGSDYEAGIAQDFIDMYVFATSTSGPGLTTGEALAVARETVEKGPTATANFKDAFRYGVSNSGLKLATNDALKFAQKMAGSSSESTSARVPAFQSKK